MLRVSILFAALATLCASLGVADAALIGPYSADVNTLVLYHFDEASGASDPGNPIVNFGTVGSGANLTNTGGPDGRDNTGAGGYGETAHAGFGSAFNVLNSGTGTFHNTTVSNGGGLLTVGAVAQSSLQGASGEFTYEAVIRFSGISAEQNIIAHDGTTNRGFLFRVTGGNLALYNGTADLTAAIPLTGDNAFVANNWYHVAVTYSGVDGAVGNVKFYWTALDGGATQANQIGGNSITLSADVPTGSGNALGIGTTTRNQFRFESEIVDEVRISNIARSATDFMFVPEPAAPLLLGFAGMLALLRRRPRTPKKA